MNKLKKPKVKKRMKSKKHLESLTKFLEVYPELRFWQGLLAWVQKQNKQISRIQADDVDTFYWE